MAVDIPLNIRVEHKIICSMMKRGYLTPNNYKSKVMNTSDIPLESNKWYLIDISGSNGGWGFEDEPPHYFQDIELIYVEKSVMTRPLPTNTGMNGWYINGPGTTFIDYDNFNKSYPIVDITHHNGYGVYKCFYIPIDINDEIKFINWINRNPMEVKE